MFVLSRSPVLFTVQLSVIQSFGYTRVDWEYKNLADSKGISRFENSFPMLSMPKVKYFVGLQRSTILSSNAMRL